MKCGISVYSRQEVISFRNVHCCSHQRLFPRSLLFITLVFLSFPSLQIGSHICFFICLPIISLRFFSNSSFLRSQNMQLSLHHRVCFCQLTLWYRAFLEHLTVIQLIDMEPEVSSPPLQYLGIRLHSDVVHTSKMYLRLQFYLPSTSSSFCSESIQKINYHPLHIKAVSQHSVRSVRNTSVGVMKNSVALL